MWPISVALEMIERLDFTHNKLKQVARVILGETLTNELLLRYAMSQSKFHECTQTGMKGEKQREIPKRLGSDKCGHEKYGWIKLRAVRVMEHPVGLDTSYGKKILVGKKVSLKCFTNSVSTCQMKLKK